MGNDTEQTPLQEAFRKPFSQFLNIKEYWKTRKAILNGLPLYDSTSNEFTKDGYLGHWVFNIQKSALASFPIVVVLTVLNYFFDGYKNAPQNLALLDNRTRIYLETVQITSHFFSAFFAPALLTLFVYLLAWGSLKKSDSTRDKRARAQRAYLYFDGAHGLYPQFLFSLVLSLGFWVSDYDKLLDKLPSFVSSLWFIFLLISFAGQLINSNITIPRQLFKINGYSSRVRHFWQKKRPDDPPTRKYTFAFVVCTWPVTIILLIVLTFLTIVTAKALTTIKLLFV